MFTCQLARRLHPLLTSKSTNIGATAGLRTGIHKAAAKDDEKLSSEPVQFFGSEAANWKARDSRSGGADHILWYQPYVISGSLAVFLIYFCMLREENDIDRKLEGNLFDHVQGLEELQLAMSYKYNRENGLETRQIEKRLEELGVDVKKIDLS